MEKVKVLIADDNESLLSGLQIQLQSYGLEVVACTNADLAVAYAEKHRPDVMVLDIRMDVEHRNILSSTGDGFGILERIGKIPGLNSIPIIYMTGDNSSQLELRAQEQGAFGLIHKPLNLPSLVKMIQAAAKSACTCSCIPGDAQSRPEFQISPERDPSQFRG
jgi:CheY-like chemotaxis protein